MSASVWSAIERGDVKPNEEALNACGYKSQVLQCGEYPLVCRASSQGLNNFLKGNGSVDVSVDTTSKLE